MPERIVGTILDRRQSKNQQLSGALLNISTARLLLLGRFGRLAHIGGDGGHGRKG
jgi:hypothetical protein